MGMALNLDKKDSIEFEGSDPNELRLVSEYLTLFFTFDTLSGENEGRSWTVLKG